MNIIKQNDEAGGLIFRQNTAGKAMKQNYNFDKCVNLPSSASMYIELPFAGLDPLNFSFIHWIKKFNYAPSDKATFLSFLIGTDKFQTREQATIRFEKNTTGTFFALSGDVNHFAVVSNGSDRFNVYFNGVEAGVTTFSGSISQMRLSYNLMDTKFGSQQKLDELSIYARNIAGNEITYNYSNRVGNELLNSLGLYSRYIFSDFELYDFGSGLEVALMDVSGNGRHGRFVGLPAGTPSEKLAYANSNYIKVW
jgi:hypothetical protein